ncbi:hypothetical protein [Myroides sp. LJL119]
MIRFLIGLGISLIAMVLISCQTQGIYPQKSSSNKELVSSITQQLKDGRKVGNLRLFSKDILDGELGGFCVSYIENNQATNHFYELEAGSFTTKDIQVFKQIDPFFTPDAQIGQNIDKFPLDSIPFYVDQAKKLLDKKYAQISLYRYDFVVDTQKGIKQEFILNAVTQNQAKTSHLSIGTYNYYSFHFIVDNNKKVKLISP